MAGESRNDLLAWINDLLQADITKVEQCGTGAVYCQIIDSVYGDVQMSKVKLMSRQEYEYLTNYKVLQAAFNKHGIDKPIPVERLVKCKMQDNLEFLQWLRKYWDLHYPGGEYDAVGRRKGQGIGGGPGSATMKTAPGARPARATPAPRRPAASTASTTASARTSAATTGRAGAASRTTMGSRAGNNVSRAGSSAAQAAEIASLTTQVNSLTLNVDGLENERDFYFNKLREIEILVEERLSLEEECVGKEKAVLTEIQGILYAADDEVPPEGDELSNLIDEARLDDGDLQLENEELDESHVVDDLETF